VPIGGTHSSGLSHELQREAGFVQDFTIIPAQVRNHAAIVQVALEDIYSWRENDPSSKITVEMLILH
jgi:predicted RNA methylase